MGCWASGRTAAVSLSGAEPYAPLCRWARAISLSSLLFVNALTVSLTPMHNIIVSIREGGKGVRLL